MTIGNAIWTSSWRVEAPSTRLASRTSLGTSSKNDRSIQTAMGRFIAVYITMSSGSWSRS